jgi:hypothetical protein
LGCHQFRQAIVVQMLDLDPGQFPSLLLSRHRDTKLSSQLPCRGQEQDLFVSPISWNVLFLDIFLLLCLRLRQITPRFVK